MAHGSSSTTANGEKTSYGAVCLLSGARRAIVRMRDELNRSDVLPRADVLQWSAGERRTLAVIPLLTYDFEAGQVNEQIQIEAAAPVMCWQEKYFSAVDLVATGGLQDTRLATAARLRPAALHLADLVQQSVQDRFAGDVAIPDRSSAARFG